MIGRTRGMGVPLILALGGCASAGSGPPAPVVEPGPAPPAEAPAPEPQLSPAQRAAQRVVRVAASEPALRLQVGETRRMTFEPRDAEGQPVAGVPVRAFLQSEHASYDPETGIVTAIRPGEATLLAIVTKRTSEGRRRMETITARVPIEVAPHPVSAVEVELPEGPIYSGLRYPLAARARSAEGDRPDVRFEWRSSDEEVARVSPFGLLTAGRAGAATLTASAEGVEGAVALRVEPNPVRDVALEPRAVELLTGEVVHFEASPRDARGRPVPVPVEWTAAGTSGQLVESEFIDQAGAFVASDPGRYLVRATVGSRSATAEVRVSPRPARRVVDRVAHAPVEGRTTSDLWVFEGGDGRDYAYTGTHAAGRGGNLMYAWDVTDAANPVITDSVVVDARVVNDVKVNADATLAVITREGAAPRKDGFVVLDLADPAHPTILSEYVETTPGGIHNTWIEDDYVYAIHNGTAAVHIIDLADPANPVEVGRWEIDKEIKYVHDIMVKDGLAYLSYWNDGLVILDVGAGIKGGTPSDPRFVSQIVTEVVEGEQTFGNTHHAIRYKNYVFLGDEIFGCSECVNGPRGYVHVIDVTDIEAPREVAWFRVPEAGTHNLWVEDDQLYIAYYQGGLRIVDVSGELKGDLYRQGREIGWYMTEDDEGFSSNQTMAWGPQPYKGNVFVSDMNSGLWILRLQPPARQLVP